MLFEIDLGGSDVYLELKAQQDTRPFTVLRDLYALKANKVTPAWQHSRQKYSPSQWQNGKLQVKGRLTRKLLTLYFGLKYYNLNHTTWFMQGT